MFRNLLVTLLFISSQANSSQAISWQDLSPEISYTIEFPELTKTQIKLFYKLTSYHDKMKESELTAEESKDFITKSNALNQTGVDTKLLLSLRDESIEMQKRLSTAIQDDLDLKQIRIAGFVVPIELDGMMTTEFLLVPTAGACIHTPPPPASQTIVVSFEKGFPFESLYTPVWVTGDIKADREQIGIYLSDGDTEIAVGYSMNASNIQLYASEQH